MDSLVRQTLAAESIVGNGASVRMRDLAGQFYVTGNAGIAPNTREGTDPYTLWLAPDRTLVVHEAAPGAPDAGFVSDMTDGLAVFDILGPRAAEIVAAGCTVPRDAVTPGRCAQTVFGGVKLVLYAHGDGFRLHVERPFAAFLLQYLSRAVAALGE